MEKFDLENFPTSESARKMLNYVSDGFYDESYVGKWIFQAMGIEYDSMLEVVRSLPEQMFPETATWALMYHEVKWGLPVRENLDYRERRKLIYRKRDCRAPMTPYRMEEYLKNEIDFEVYVADCHDPGKFGYAAIHPNIFRVTFVGEGTLDAKKAREILEKIKQSHTTYTLEDMIMAIINNKDLEKMIADRMDIYTGFHFFAKLLNGGWILDGSVSLGQIPICEIDMEIVVGTISIVTKGNVCVPTLDISAVFPMALPESRHGMENGFCIDSSGIQDAEMKDIGVNIPVRVETGVVADSVTIEKDLWHLDGQVMLGGQRMLDAEVWKERL